MGISLNVDTNDENEFNQQLQCILHKVTVCKVISMELLF